MLIFSDAVSLQMLDGDYNISIHNIGIEDVRDILWNRPFFSCVSDADIASVLSNKLQGIEIPCNKINMKLITGDTLIVAQVIGGQLPKGATTLPEGMTIKFTMVTIVKSYILV